MTDQVKKNDFFPVIIIAGLFVAALVVWKAVFYTPAAGPEPPIQEQKNPSEFAQTAKKSANLDSIIRSARTWGPVFTSWYGKKAPDFALKDTNGKEHKLSDYRGKDVLLVFWATWCGPCIMEIPHLIALRNLTGEDELAMLAISNENPALVKDFAAKKGLNYTVLHSTTALPPPYNQIRGIPSSFFIAPDGTIKLATSGTLSLGELRAILSAK